MDRADDPKGIIFRESQRPNNDGLVTTSRTQGEAEKDLGFDQVAVEGAKTLERRPMGKDRSVTETEP